MDFLKKYKSIFIGVAVVVLLILMFGGGKGPEKVAKSYMNAILDGDAKKVVKLTSDETIESSGIETKKLFINYMEKELDDAIEYYEDKYGDNWKYKVKVIDSYDCSDEMLEDGKFVVVFLEVNHKGSGWLNDKEGTEEFELILKKEGGKWKFYE